MQGALKRDLILLVLSTVASAGAALAILKYEPRVVWLFLLLALGLASALISIRQTIALIRRISWRHLRPDVRSDSYRWYAVVILISVAIAYCQIRFAVETYDTWTTPEAYRYIPLRLVPFTDLVESGLAGDENHLLAVNGRRFTGESIFYQELREYEARRKAQLPFRAFHVTVRMPSGRVTVVKLSLPDGFCCLGVSWWLVGLLISMTIVWPLLGIVVVALRPHSRLAWILLGLTLAIAQFDLVPNSFSVRTAIQAEGFAGWVRYATLIYRTAATQALPIWVLMFLLHFAEPFPAKKERVWLQWMLLVPLTLWVALEVALALGRSEGLATMAPIYWFVQDQQIAGAIFMMFACAIVFSWMAARRGSLGTVLTWTSPLWLFMLWLFIVALPAFLHTLALDLEVVGARFYSVWPVNEYRFLTPISALALFGVALSFCVLEVKRRFSTGTLEWKRLSQVETAGLILLIPLPLPLMIAIWDDWNLPEPVRWRFDGFAFAGMLFLLAFLFFLAGIVLMNREASPGTRGS